jgi:hypothetical protein
VNFIRPAARGGRTSKHEKMRELAVFIGLARCLQAALAFRPPASSLSSIILSPNQKDVACVIELRSSQHVLGANLCSRGDGGSRLNVMMAVGKQLYRCSCSSSSDWFGLLSLPRSVRSCDAFGKLVSFSFTQGFGADAKGAKEKGGGGKKNMVHTADL